MKSMSACSPRSPRRSPSPLKMPGSTRRFAARSANWSATSPWPARSSSACCRPGAPRTQCRDGGALPARAHHRRRPLRLCRLRPRPHRHRARRRQRQSRARCPLCRPGQRHHALAAASSPSRPPCSPRSTTPSRSASSNRNTSPCSLPCGTTRAAPCRSPTPAPSSPSSAAPASRPPCAPRAFRWECFPTSPMRN